MNPYSAPLVANESAMPLENFIKAVQSQLDKAQTAMTMKARNLNMPLTFAIKDITLDLRAHVEFAKSEIRIRPAGANDTEASVFHLVFAAITRPMIEENSAALGAEDPEDRGIDEIEGDSLSEDERRQLEWIGVRTVGQLRDIEAKGGGKTVQRVTGLPVTRLRAALERASAPLVEHVSPVDRRPEDTNEPPLIRLRGHNLLAGGGRPRVTVDGSAMAIVSASDRELLLAPQAHQWAGELAVIPASGTATALAFDLTPFAPAPRTEGAA
ncbi:MAG: hypothetical protein ABI624_02015 [Casimicrobiaceae bacterium]